MRGPQGPRAVEAPSCPLLGLPNDAVTRFSFPSVAHRCRATDHPRPIDLGHQGTFCLAATYTDCPRYQAAATPRRASGTVLASPAPRDARTTVPEPVKATKMAGAPTAPLAPGDRGAHHALDRNAQASPGPTGGSRRRRRVAAVVLTAIVLAGAAYLTSPMIVDWVRQMGVGGPASSPLLSTAPRTSPTQASSTPVPTGTPTPEPTPTTTPKPTRSPISLTHVVLEGETLTGIAARYGVTVAAIKEANAITDVSLIYVGEHLVIPSH